MTMSQPRLSVVMPNYNHSRALPVSVGAILSQTRPPDEIVIVDDGSTDHSLAVLEAFARGNARIRIIQHETNKGVVAAVNRGIQEATGDFVFLASADEQMMPEACEVLMAALEQNPGSQLVVSAYTEWYPATGEVVVHDRHSERGLWFIKPGEEQCALSPRELEAILKQAFAFLSINTAIFRRQALLDAGLYDPALRWHSDWFLIYCIALRHGVVAVDRSLVWFRVDEGSYSGHGMRQPAQQRAVAAAIQAKLREPEYADFRAALLRAPSAMTTFMRGTLMTLAASPRQYGALAMILKWWLLEVLHGRRPGFLKRFTERRRQASLQRRERLQ
ncbi:MAG TPA: glycosyltransferase family 2 protein [Bosea sp. (in: a-proteobacteria)]|jgi:glycosyltransferase involved in cell wall biosynthesis|uniref:glycosyltransferase family 2 protein n=1 Tax=Bosea sp. (in: a-proteobacteria) TaxID=1871050 RepID=UPI002DDD08F1|nr:glycosyltransferase family 2 protein [Bosea sp. (in: a-proteobacteria)]HEV2552949.1 glycosyltransferase family 2 protein [Bosea sp. (in: a-proteobacteria)]